MTLARLKQNRGIELRLGRISDKRYFPEYQDKIDYLISDGTILVPRSPLRHGAALEDIFELEEAHEGSLIFIDVDAIYPGGYQGNKPSKQPYYTLLSNAYMQEGIPFNLALKNLRDQVKFPNNRMGYSWPPLISAERADKRRRVISELHLNVGTILSADKNYTDKIRINGYNPQKKLRAKYRPGSGAIVELPSIESPGEFQRVNLAQMPVFPIKEVRGRLSKSQISQTYSFYPDDDCPYKIPSMMSFFRLPATSDAEHNVQGELILDHHAKPSTDAFIKWVRESQMGYQIPDLLPNAEPEMIRMFWRLYEDTYSVPAGGKTINARPLKAWEINRFLMEYRGWLNEQKKLMMTALIKYPL